MYVVVVVDANPSLETRPKSFQVPGPGSGVLVGCYAHHRRLQSGQASLKGPSCCGLLLVVVVGRSFFFFWAANKCIMDMSFSVPS